MYNTNRFFYLANFTNVYSIPLAASVYDVTLYFAEGYEPLSAVGGRVYNVYINSVPSMSSFDAVRTAGFQRPVSLVRMRTGPIASLQFILSCSCGPGGADARLFNLQTARGVAMYGANLTIGFTNVVDNPQISGFSITTHTSSSSAGGLLCMYTHSARSITAAAASTTLCTR